ncbi:DUF397 domain-containing protein [Micromonosporaceae bacterium Da 78-11]
MERNVWRKSTRSSGSGQCVEVMATDDAVLVRDTKDRNLPAHRYTHAEWAAFVGGVRDGEFDL